MANSTYDSHLLTEDDIPGSSLSGRNPQPFKTLNLDSGSNPEVTRDQNFS